MINRQLQQIRSEFPDLPRRAMEFFDTSNLERNPNGFLGRTVMEFVTSAVRPNPNSSFPSNLMPPPNLVAIILDKMADVGVLINQGADSSPFSSRYICLKSNGAPDQIFWREIVDFVVYGFPAIIEAYSNSVFQIVTYSGEDQSSGTCFAISERRLLTAAHCVEEAGKFGIEGLEKSNLVGSKIFLSRNKNTDCAVIELPGPILSGRLIPQWADADILDDVVLLGYPNIPTLLSVRIAEKANVSTILRGAVASEVSDIFNTELLLITAPVRGGFSGGPVINSSGLAVGMISRQPSTQFDQSEIQRYDAAGFGLAIPRSALSEFLHAIDKNDTRAFEEREQSTFEWVD